MIEMIERLGKLGFSLHEQLGKDAILNSLPSSYLDFLSHYRMTKPTVNYHGLLDLLQTFEKDHQLQKKSMNLVGGSGAGRHPLKKGIKKKNKGKKVQHAGPSQTKKKRANKNKMECFYYKKLGHWKRNYPQYIATLDPNRLRKKKQQGVAGQGTYVITPCSFSICDTTNWVLDTESLIHICNSL